MAKSKRKRPVFCGRWAQTRHDFMMTLMNNATVYYNGQLVSAADARIGTVDGGWLHGAGLFETMRAENGRLFRLESHIERLRSSATKLMRSIERIELPSRVDFLELLERNQLTDARVRLTVSAGDMTVESVSDRHWTVVATAAPLVVPATKLYQDGAQVAISSYRVSPLDPTGGHKTTSYLPRLLGLREAQQKQCMEALWFTTRNTLAEGCISNVFVVKNDTIKTPPLDTPVLPGIARATVLELARSLKIAATETALSIDDLLDADEVFLTNMVMQVMPVTKIERRDIADGKVGPMARRLRAAFDELVRKECAAE